MGKKSKNRLNWKTKKNNRKNRTEKNRLNWLKFWKNRPVWFGFISKKLKKPNWNKKIRKNPSQTGKTEPNQKNQAKQKKIQPKPEKTEPKPRKPSPVWTGFCPKKTEPVGLTWFRFGLVFFLNNSVWLFFLIKTEPNRK